MKKILCILFVFLFPSSVVANEIPLLILDKLFKYGNNVCNEEDYGDYYLTGNPISLIDISNDGIQDLIIDPYHQICGKSHSFLKGGTGGNDFIFFINPTIDIVKSWDPDEWGDDQEKRIYHLFIRSFEIVKWEEKNALKVQVHGISCGVSGAQGCYEILSATKKGFILLDGPHPNPE